MTETPLADALHGMIFTGAQLREMDQFKIALEQVARGKVYRLSSEELERIAKGHAPPAWWYHSKEKKPF